MKLAARSGVSRAEISAIETGRLTAAGLLPHDAWFDGRQMHPRAGASPDTTLLVESSDGYRVVYALPEIDEQFTDDITILAYQRGGGPLPANDGAFRFVHSGDTRHARWAGHVTALTVKRVL